MNILAQTIELSGKESPWAAVILLIVLGGIGYGSYKIIMMILSALPNSVKDFAAALKESDSRLIASNDKLADSIQRSLKEFCFELKECIRLEITRVKFSPDNGKSDMTAGEILKRKRMKRQQLYGEVIGMEQKAGEANE